MTQRARIHVAPVESVGELSGELRLIETILDGFRGNDEQRQRQRAEWVHTYLPWTAAYFDLDSRWEELQA